MSLYLGLMSGTSMDGIDAAIINCSDQQFIAGHTYPYSRDLKKQILELTQNAAVKIEKVFQINRLIGEAFAEAAQSLMVESGIKPNEIEAIGSHGQTIIHAPQATPGYTIQLGCGHTIAARTGVKVVADFRMRDIVQGGEGAPLAPLYHQVLFQHQPRPIAILNIGGIANLTVLDQAGSRGHDVGPGNCLLDAWVQEALGRPFDEQGQWAFTGKVLPDLLHHCYQDPYFSLLPPKSLDKSYFSLQWLHSKLTGRERPQDIQATLVALTAQAVAEAAHQAGNLTMLIVCGGGVYNEALLSAMKSLLPSLNICSSQSLDIPPDFIEAMMCAWLAAQCVEGVSLDLAGVTGGRRSILGCIYPAWVETSQDLKVF